MMPPFNVYDQVEVPVMVLTHDGQLRFANRACRERFHLENDTQFPLGSRPKGTFQAELQTHHSQTLHTRWAYRQTDDTVVCTFQHAEEKQSTISFYETLIRTMAEGVVMHDVEGRIVLANKSAQRILGLTAEQIVGKTSVDPAWYTIRKDGSPFPGDEHPAMLALKTGEPQHNVVMGVRKPGGELTWISINAEPILLGEGGVLVSFADITRLIDMQSVLERSEKRYRAMFESHSAVMLLIDPKTGHIVDANRAACAFYGYDREGLLAKRIQDINVLPQRRIEAQMRRAMINEANHFYFVHRLANGELRNVEVYSVALELDGRTMLYSIVHDVTARYAAEKALRLSEERFRRVAETARDAIITTDLTGIILYWNKAAQEMFGYTEAEVMGAHLNLIVPSEYTSLHEERFTAYRQRPLGEYASHMIEVDGLHKSGRRIPVEVSLAGWNIDQVHYLTAIIRDVTNRRLAERQRVELAVEREKSAVLSSFIQDASHEFRSPLSVIMTNIFLLDRIEDEAKRDAKKEQIRDAVRELSHLLEGIIELVELEHYILSDVTPIDLGVLVRSVLVDLQELVEHKEHTVHVDIPADLPAAYGHQGKLFRAIYHVVHNALHFTPEKGTITITGKAEGDNVHIEVADDGLGLSAETQKHMFDRFWRYDKAHTTAGFGLGLPIAQQVVGLHHGRIEWESTLGEGATFTIVLPQKLPVEGV